MNVERRPGESRSEWVERALRQRADDQRPGTLMQLFYDLTARLGSRMLRLARSLDGSEPGLRPPPE